MDNTDRYIGQFLDNRYEILEKIGSGGMAVVYKARCHRLNRLVAIKILKDELAGDADFRRRFRTESQAVAMLSHPNIVAVFDVSRSGNIEYIVMELIEGITLKQYINRKGLLNWKEALHFATQVAKALGHAHSRGIIHRDIKPHNIMILKDGSIKVADFGIARLQSTQNTLTQEALGSVHYISPEQAKGSHVDARSDIYSLGVVMYEMLTSHLPFEGDSAVSIAIQHISAIPLMPRELNPDIPVGLESITMHAMEPDLNLRYASADEILADLEEFRKNPGINFTFYVNDNSRNIAEQATRHVPSGAIVKAESTLPKPVRTQTRNIELTKDEYRETTKRSSKTATLVGIFVIIVFIIGAVVFIWKYIGPIVQPPEPEQVMVPSFVGQAYDDIVKDKELQQNYSFVKEEQYDNTVKAGYVISQNPTPRKMPVPTNSTITVTLTVSLGKAPAVAMPDLFNIEYRKANQALQEIEHQQGWDLDIQLQYENHESITKDYVIRTSPESGEELHDKMTIYIIYSLGPDKVMVDLPNVVGKTLAVAQSELRDMGFNPIVDQYVHDDEFPKGTVISQYPNDKQAESKSDVRLMVSDGPEEPSPSPSPSEEPTPSVEPTPTGEPTTSPLPSWPPQDFFPPAQ